MAGTALTERLLGPALDPDDALRLTLDVARDLAAVHARGTAHGRVEPASVTLEGDAVRLGEATSDAPRSRRDDLRGLGRVLLAALAGRDPGPGLPPPPERLRPGLPTGVRDAVGWLCHPDDAHGAQSVGDAVRTLEALRAGQPVDLTTPPSWPAYSAGLPPHRVALRMACQGGVVGLCPLPLLAVFVGPLDVWLPAMAAAATVGVVVTLGEELARPRPRLRFAIAPLAAAVGPALALGAAGVVGAVQAGETPLTGVTGVLDLAGSEGRDLVEVTALLALPLLAFVLARVSRSSSPTVLAVSLAAVCSLPAGLVTGAGPLAVVSTAVWTGALGVALKVGRWLEARLAGPAP